MPLVSVLINRQAATMVVDTGAERSILTEDAAARLHLPEDVGHLSHTVGIGGTSTAWDVKLASLVIGGVRFPVDRMAVGRFRIAAADHDAPVGLLGSDILLAFDLDIDLARKAITLYGARRCNNAGPPWQDQAIAIPGVTTRKDRVLIPLSLDGQLADGILDTGAQHTTIGAQLAARLGIVEASMRTDPVIMQHGAGPTAIPASLHKFSNLTIGPAVTRDPQLSVMPGDFGIGDALVGQDFLKTRRVWISFATRQVFVTALPGDGGLEQTPPNQDP